MIGAIAIRPWVADATADTMALEVASESFVSLRMEVVPAAVTLAVNSTSEVALTAELGPSTLLPLEVELNTLVALLEAHVVVAEAELAIAREVSVAPGDDAAAASQVIYAKRALSRARTAADLARRLGRR